MRNISTALLFAQLPFLLITQLANATALEDLEAENIAVPSGAPLTLSRTRDCLIARASAERELRLAAMPEIESSFQAQAEPTASTGQDRTRTRSRVGLSYDVADLARALGARDRAEEECSSQGQGAARLTEEISLLRKRRILAGVRAALRIYEDALPQARQQRVKLDASLRQGLVSVRDSDDFSAYLLELELRTIELQDLLARSAGEDGFVRPETEEFFSPSANETNSDPSRLIQPALSEELNLAVLRATRRTDSSWSLRIAGGYEQLSQTQGKAVLPGYATAELRYKLGSLWPDSQSLGNSHPSAEGSTSASVQEIAKTLQRSISEYQLDQKMWAKQYALVKQRSEEFAERVKLEEATLKSDSLAATRKGMLEISRNRLSLLARAADLGARSGKSAASSPARGHEEGKKEPSFLGFEVTSGTVERAPPAALGDSKATFQAQKDLMRTYSAGPSEAGPTSLTKRTGSPTMRMHANVGSPQRISLAFRYKGSVTAPKPLAGGDTRNQLGVFLLGKDQCNLLYAMLRFPAQTSQEHKGKPESKSTSSGSEKASVNLVVQTKTNPNQSTHNECGNRGYTSLKPRLQMDIDESLLNDGKIHVLTASAKSVQAKEQKVTLEVTLDGRIVWDGEIPKEFADRMDKPGLIGVRSDNATFEFEASELSLSSSQFRD